MARVVLLDSGPLGLACSRPGIPTVDQCRAWLSALESAGVEVLIPSVCDFEVRRELVRVGARFKLRNLDLLRSRFGYIDTSQTAWDHAAGLWALVRKSGLPTAGDGDLDADAILAGTAATAGLPGDAVTIATTNLRHLVRFPGVEARTWTTIS
jgi:predicted nucleic acid-binding protein